MIFLLFVSIILLIVLILFVRSRIPPKLLDGTRVSHLDMRDSPFSRRAYLPSRVSDSDDEWDDEEWGDEEDECLEGCKHARKVREILFQGDMPLRIDYLDFKGDKSVSRKVDMEELYKLGGHFYMLCYCHRRRETRTFRSDRIWSAVEMVNGEVFDDWHHLVEHISK